MTNSFLKKNPSIHRSYSIIAPNLIIVNMASSNEADKWDVVEKIGMLPEEEPAYSDLIDGQDMALLVSYTRSKGNRIKRYTKPT